MLPRLLTAAAVLLLACNRGDKAPAEQQSEPVPAAKANLNALCTATVLRGKGLQLMAASYGDVIAIKLGDDAGARRIARTKAKELQAAAAYDIPISGAFVRAGTRVIPRMLIGLPGQGRPGVQPFVTNGRLPEPGQSELVMSTSDAETLGVSLGASVVVSMADGLGGAGPNKTMTLVGVVELTEPIWTGIDAASMWTAAEDVSPATMTYVGVLLAKGADHEAWTLRYQAALGSEYDAMTADSLQAPLVQWRSRVAAFCQSATKVGRDAKPFRVEAWPCDELAEWDSQGEAARNVWGDEILWRTTPDGEGSWATDVEGVRLEPVAAYGGAIFDDRRAFPFSVHGFSDAGLERLAPYVTKGDLGRVTATDGLVLTTELAAALGVGPGDTVQVALGSGDESGHATGDLHNDSLHVAALVKFPRRLTEGVAMHGWIHAGRRVGTLSVQANAALAWGPMADISAAAEGLSPPTRLGFVGGDAREADRQLHDALSNVCSASP